MAMASVLFMLFSTRDFHPSQHDSSAQIERIKRKYLGTRLNAANITLKVNALSFYGHHLSFTACYLSFNASYLSFINNF